MSSWKDVHSIDQRKIRLHSLRMDHHTDAYTPTDMSTPPHGESVRHRGNRRERSPNTSARIREGDHAHRYDDNNLRSADDVNINIDRVSQAPSPVVPVSPPLRHSNASTPMPHPLALQSSRHTPSHLPPTHPGSRRYRCVYTFIRILACMCVCCPIMCSICLVNRNTCEH